MAQIIPREGMLIVPQGKHPVLESFTNFLWDNELGAFLAKPSWAGEQESGATAYGVRVAPGTA